MEYSNRRQIICPSDWGEHWSQKESHLDGLWHPRQGMDCSGLLPVLCQTGDTDHAITFGRKVLLNVFALGLIRSWMRPKLRAKWRRWWPTWTSTSRRCSTWTATCTLGRTARTTRSVPAINEHFSHYFCWALELGATTGRGEDGICQLIPKNNQCDLGNSLDVPNVERKMPGTTWFNIPGVFQYRLWRKSRSPGPAGCLCNGTDLNRNFDANWGSECFAFQNLILL